MWRIMMVVVVVALLGACTIENRIPIPAAPLSDAGVVDGGVVDAGNPDAGVTIAGTTVRVALEAPATEALDQPRICGSFPGDGWKCVTVAPGGANGRTLTAEFGFTRSEHIYNVCFRTCDDRLLGRWALHKGGNGQQVVLAQAVVTVGSATVPSTTVDNGLNSYNWRVDLRNQ